MSWKSESLRAAEALESIEGMLKKYSECEAARTSRAVTKQDLDNLELRVTIALGAVLKTLDVLQQKEIEIMQTQADLLVIAQAAKAALETVASGLSDVAAELQKVGTETDSLNAKIVELQKAVDGQTNPSPELVDSFLAVRDQIGVVQAGLANVKAAADLVDAKVPDAPAPAPAPEPTAGT